MLITDQVATAPCTDRVQGRRRLLRQATQRYRVTVLLYPSYPLASASCLYCCQRRVTAFCAWPSRNWATSGSLCCNMR